MTDRIFVSKNDMLTALREFGFEKDAIILTHTSLKSLGYIEDGAEGVINAISQTVPNGTVAFPTLCQKRWRQIFDEWYIDRPTDVGTINETFRKMPGVHRSNQATHSVAAIGPFSEDITTGHDKGGERFGIYRENSFSKNSPWQKMYESEQRYGKKAYVLFWGVPMTYNTYKHFCEYRLIEELIEHTAADKVEMLKSQIAVHPFSSEELNVTRFWPLYDSTLFEETLVNEGVARRIPLGEGYLTACNIKIMIERIDKALRDPEESKAILPPACYSWLREKLEEAGLG